MILAPLVRGMKGEHKGILEEVKRAGFIRARIDGEVMLLEEALSKTLDKKKKHSLELIVDRFTISRDIESSRIRDSIETALKIGKGLMLASFSNQSRINDSRKFADEDSRPVSDLLFSEHFACALCGINLPEIEPRTFSFNSPYGSCPACTGLGSTLEVDPKLVIPNMRLSVAEGAIRPWASVPRPFRPGSRSPSGDLGTSHRLGRQSWYWWILDDLAGRYKFSLNSPVEKLSKHIFPLILYV